MTLRSARTRAWLAGMKRSGRGIGSEDKEGCGAQRVGMGRDGQGVNGGDDGQGWGGGA